MRSLEDKVQNVKAYADQVNLTQAEMRRLPFEISEMIDNPASTPGLNDIADRMKAVKYHVSSLGFDVAELRRLRFEISEMNESRATAELKVDVKSTVDKRAGDIEEMLEMIWGKLEAILDKMDVNHGGDDYQVGPS